VPGGTVAVDQEQLTEHAAEHQPAEEALRRLNRTLRTITECNQAVVRAGSEPELLQAICRIVVERGGYRMAWVGFAEADEAKTVRPAAHAGVEQGYLDVLDITYADTERGRGPAGTVIRERRVFICRDIFSDPRFPPWRDEALRRGYASVIALPLLRNREAFGALNIYSPQPDAFDAEEESLLTELANDLAYGITALRTRAERERAEAALRESEERFRVLVDQSFTGIGVIQDDRFVYVNPRLAQVAGYQQDEMLRIPPIDIVAEADREVFRENMRRRMSGEVRSVHYTFGARRKDGADIVVEAYGSRITYNRRPALLSTLLDITERNQAEVARRESEERLSLALEAARMGTWDWDLITGRVIWSRGHEELWGYAPRTFHGTYEEFSQRVHPDDRPALEQAVQASLVTGGDHAHEFRLVWPDGSVHWIHGRGRPYRDAAGKTVRMVGLAMDITERKRAEEALRESEERLRLAVAGADLGTWHWDLRTGELFWSERSLAMSGLPPGTPISYEQFLATLHPDDRARVESAVERAWREGSEYDIEYRTVWPDGTVRWAASKGRAYYDAAGQPLRMEGVALDITERKRAEEKIQEQLEELQRSYDLMLGREDRVQELKREVNELLKRHGESARYASEET
jgi:PAS domain S-box-containing protein